MSQMSTEVAVDCSMDLEVSQTAQTISTDVLQQASTDSPYMKMS